VIVLIWVSIAAMAAAAATVVVPSAHDRLWVRVAAWVLFAASVVLLYFVLHDKHLVHRIYWQVPLALTILATLGLGARMYLRELRQVRAS
jgi:hypothetical protein